MLSERSYSRNAYRRERTSALTWLLCGLFAAFVLQLVVGSRWMHGEEELYRSIGVTIPGLAAGKIWTLLTHLILHRPGFIIHPIGNLLLLHFLGRELIPRLGQTRFFGLFAGASAAGAMAWTAVHWRFGGGDMLIGATTAVYALSTLYACIFPHQELRFLLFFVVPVNLKPRHVVLSLVSFDALGLLLYEIPGTPLPLNMVIAHSAHLGGMATAYLYYRYFHDRPQSVRRVGKSNMTSPGRNHPARVPLPALPEPGHESASPAPLDIRVEVDRILDKINNSGFASLTVQERKLLDEAKHTLSRR